MKYLNYLFRPFRSFTNAIAVFIAGVGSGIVLYGYLLTVAEDSRSWKAFVSQGYVVLGINLLICGLLIVILEKQRYRVARKARFEELIVQLGSPNQTFAIEAVRQLDHLGAIQDGTLKGIDLRGANLERAPLQGANLQDSYLWGANLIQAHLEGANLRHAHLDAANLQGAHFEGANLQEAVLMEANLCESVWLQANLQKALLASANMESGCLQWANLQGADLWGANLQKADLWKADFQDANLTEANLQSAGDFESARVNENTTLPDGQKWKPGTDVTRFTDPYHPSFWRSIDAASSAYLGGSARRS